MNIMNIAADIALLPFEPEFLETQLCKIAIIFGAANAKETTNADPHSS